MGHVLVGSSFGAPYGLKSGQSKVAWKRCGFWKFWVLGRSPLQMTCVYRTWKITMMIIKNSNCDITGACGLMWLRSVRWICTLHAGYTWDKRGRVRCLCSLREGERIVVFSYYLLSINLVNIQICYKYPYWTAYGAYAQVTLTVRRVYLSN
jgi:hypothetical protein